MKGTFEKYGFKKNKLKRKKHSSSWEGKLLLFSDL